MSNEMTNRETVTTGARTAVDEEAVICASDRHLRGYGDVRHGNKENPLDELVFIILSAQTEAYSYHTTYDALARAFPGWRGIPQAEDGAIAAVIRSGGLANKKARQIKGALTRIEADFGTLSLDSLRDLGDHAAERYLVSLPGVGVKTAKCILLYSLGRAVFPVDTHCWRVCRRLGLTPMVPKPTPPLELELETKVPPDLRYTFHVNLVSHGQETCLPYWPRCRECVLADLCPSAFRSDDVWAAWSEPKGVWARAVGSQEGAAP